MIELKEIAKIRELLFSLEKKIEKLEGSVVSRDVDNNEDTSDALGFIKMYFKADEESVTTATEVVDTIMLEFGAKYSVVFMGRVLKKHFEHLKVDRTINGERKRGYKLSHV